MNVISIEDINYLSQQSSGKINMILSGMTSLMNDTDNKVSAMESQNWFMRMVKTVFGKNKATQQEIQQNQICDPAKDLHKFGIRGKHRGLLKIRYVPYFIMEE